MATNNSTVKFVEISRAKFNALTKDVNTFYVVIETNASRKLYQGSNLLTPEASGPPTPSWKLIRTVTGEQLFSDEFEIHYGVTLALNKQYMIELAVTGDQKLEWFSGPFSLNTHNINMARASSILVDSWTNDPGWCEINQTRVYCGFGNVDGYGSYTMRIYEFS